MGIRDLFGNKVLSKPIPSEALETLGREVESTDFIDSRIEEKNRFIAHVNYASASNFAKYGSAEKYYESSIKRIYDQYPYDGSKSEIREFFNDSSYLDLYMFSERYPRTTGFANLGLTSMAHAAKVGGWGRSATTKEYIEVAGGPHTSSAGMIGKPLADAFGNPTYRTSPNSNTYDTDIYTTANTIADERVGSRESNLKFDLSDGMTVEFWMKKEAFLTAQTEKEVILDLWNGTPTGSAGTSFAPRDDYGRLLIYMDGGGSAGNVLRFHLASGSTVWEQSLGDSDITTAQIADNQWHHYAISFASSSIDSQLQAKLYISGNLYSEHSADTGTFGPVTGSLKARIGALQTAPSGNLFFTNLANFDGASKMSASVDEFRFWKTKRTSQDIGRNWFTQVGGGTNNDISNAELGFYFKFNEGTVGDTATDSIVLDYSGRISNGNWVGYPGATARDSGSAMVISSASLTEFEDPIIYSSHPDVANLEDALKVSGSYYDSQNPGSLYHSLPSFMPEEDEDSTLHEITQIMASYMDTLHLQIEALPRLKDAYFDSASFKPVPFSNRLLESHGFETSEIFANANILAQIGNRDEKREFELDLEEVKNRIYKNIYNTLIHLYKSKGTETAFRNLIRCFGVDEELIKINLYGNNITHAINDNSKFVATKTKAINFNTPDNFGATVVQWTGSNTNENAKNTHFSGSRQIVNDGFDRNARTAEVQVIFPKKIPRDHQEYFPTTFLSSSVFGHHELGTHFASSNAGNPENNEWHPTAELDIGFQLYAVRPEEESNDAHFILKSRSGAFLLTSSLYKDVYDNQKWTFGVRTRNVSYNHPVSFGHSVSGAAQHTTASGLIAPNSDSDRRLTSTVLEFYGVNTDLDIVKNEFYLTKSELDATVHDGRRRYYAGADRENFTGSIQTKSDIKLLSLRHWETYVDNESIKAHSMDPENYGTKNPSQSTHFKSTGSLDGNWIPEFETLAMHWDFSNVTGSDDLGNFLINDISSGSLDLSTEVDGAARYPTYLGEIITNQYAGLGYGFLASSTSSIDTNYIPSARLQPVEVMNSVDMINVVNRDDDKFTRESRPINYFFAFEKSMYRTISEEMLKMFATIVEFNNLIGRPVDKYRTEYKEMRKLRNLFFERIGNTPDLEKYVSYYKWIDGALGQMLQQLVPASADVSDGLRTMVESHELDRSKYRHKFPNIKHVEPDFTGHIYGIEELMYDWEHGHAPIATQATATVSVADGDAASGMTEKEVMTITSTDGTTRNYVVIDDNATTVATGAALTTTSDTGANQAGTKATATFIGTAALNNADGTNIVLTNTDGSTVTFHTDPTKNFGDTSDDGGDHTWVVNTRDISGGSEVRKATQAFHIACLTAIAAGELDMTADPATDTGTQTSFTLTQNTAGTAGNTAITLVTGMTADASTFTGGAEVAANSVAVAINTTGTAATQNDFLVQLKAAIESENGHNGKILVSAVPAEDNGAQAITLTQAQGGFTGNTGAVTTNTGLSDNISQTTLTQFTGGDDKQSTSAQWWKNRAERNHPTFETPDVVDRDRARIRQIAPSHISGTGPIHANESKTEYTGSAYALRNFTKVYRFGTSVEKPIHGGSNYGLNKPGLHNKKPDIVNSVADYDSHDISVYPAAHSQSIEAVKDNLIPPELRKIRKSFKAEIKDIDGDNEFKGSLVTPFTMYSSSIKTGYQSLTELGILGHNIDLTNMHSDVYGDDYEVPMQGPFTEKFVGGNQHRHVDLNRSFVAGEHDPTSHPIDTNETRPERWEFEWNSPSAGNFDIKSRHNEDISSYDRPSAHYYRDEVAKRPVNIKNIKMTSSKTTQIVSGTLNASVGNYSKVYEIVQTSDRSVNNRAFTRAEGFSATNTTEVGDALVEGLIDYAKPVRERTEHVFVERFSAPGGPETAGDSNGGPGLDLASAQFSPYNDLNSRNSTVRQPLNTLHSERSELYGLRKSSGTGYGVSVGSPSDISADYTTNYTASFHKVNRNRLKRLEFESGSVLDNEAGTVITGTQYDNFYIQHAIPRSDTQYSWISSSLISAEELGHVARLDGLYESDNGTAASILFVTGNIFGGTISEADGENEDFDYIDAAGHYVDTVGLNKYIYEPVSSSLGRLGYPLTTPVSDYLKTDVPGPTDGANATVAIPTGSYLNSLIHHRGYRGYPSWKQIRVGEHPVVREWRKKNLYVINTQSVSIAIHENPFYTYRRLGSGELASFQEPPVVSVHYPNEYGVSHTVKGEITSTDVKGTYGNLVDYFVNPLLEETVKTCADKNPCPPTHLKITSIYKNGNEISPDAAAPPLASLSETVDLSATTLLSYGKTRPKLNTLNVKQTIFPKAENAYLDKIRRRNSYANNFWKTDRANRDSTTKWLSILHTVSTTGNKLNHTYSMWNLDEHKEFTTGVAGALHTNDNSGILQNNKTHVRQNYEASSSVTASILYALRNTIPCTGSTRSRTGPNPQGPIPAAFAAGFLSYVEPLGGQAAWQAGEQAGAYDKSNTWVSQSSAPFDNTYDDWVNDLRLLNKDYSVVPEFRISDHIEYYVKTQNGNFLAEPSASFQIVGSSKLTGTIPQNSGQDDFYKTFTNSEFMRHFETMRNEHEDILDPSDITLSCKAIMKFNPYDGFYPSELLGEVFEQFSGSYYDFVKTNATTEHGSDLNSAYPNVRHRPFATPMFAPGIWMNTIKAGVAVNFPIMTGTFNIHKPLVSETSASTDFFLLGTSSHPKRDDNGALNGWDYLVPFEATVEPEKYLTNQSIFDMFPSPSASLPLTSAWGGEGDPLYKMKAHNALASMIEFFLPGPNNKGELTTFASRPEKEFGTFAKGQYYGMRVKMRQSYNLPRQVGSRFTRGYLTPHNSLTDTDTAGLRETFTMYSAPFAFGPPTSGRNNISEASASGQDSPRIIDSMFGSNPGFTPPYYDGEAWADIVYHHISDFQPTLADIISGSQVYQWRFDPQHVGTANNAQPYGHDNINLYSMQLSHSINLFGVTAVKSVEHNPDGSQTRISDDPAERSNVWTIQPKMETPMLNFKFADRQEATFGKHSIPVGMWHQFGRLPRNPKDGIFLEIEDIDPQWLQNRIPAFISSSAGQGSGYANAQEPNIGNNPLGRDYTTYKAAYNQGDVKSLLDKVKFDKKSARLGEIASKRTVKEAIVAIPYIQVRNRRKFFSIPKNSVKGAQRIIEGLETKTNPGQSIIDMVSKMKDYVFPPTMDFLKNPSEVKPFAMYIFEFEHSFDQDDLSHIWQNVRPPSGRRIKTASSTVSHRLLTNEMMGQLASTTKRPMQDRLRWMVFKVKQKANTNYFNKVIENQKYSDSRYKSSYQIGRTNTSDASKTGLGEYSYNWPYDNFSLVEFIKIDASVKFSDDFEETEQDFRPATKLKKRRDNMSKQASENELKAASLPSQDIKTTTTTTSNQASKASLATTGVSSKAKKATGTAVASRLSRGKSRGTAQRANQTTDKYNK